ncbi:MAG: hypothetical protein U0270_18735 [Labilithrix sp.]
MRHPVLSAFAMMSFIGAAGLAVACAKDGPEIEPIITGNETLPQDGGNAPNKTVTVPSKEKKPKKDAGAVTPVLDAGPIDSGAPPAGDDDDDDDDDDDVLIADCPNDSSHMNAWAMASLMGGTECTSHGTECNTNECCFVYPVPGLGKNYCVPE